MPKISSYTTATPSLTDRLIGTDANDSSATKNFTVGDVLSLTQVLVLDSFNSLAQLASAPYEPTQIIFGPIFSNDSISLDAGGAITFLESGRYIIETGFTGGQVSASPSSSSFNMYYASKLNGIQVGSTIKDAVYSVSNFSKTDTVMNTFILYVSANDVLTFYFEGASIAAGLIGTTATTFNDVPSSVIKINKA
mgnify:CR=1 FL=1